MCGRYSLTTEPEALRRLFNFDNRPNFAPRYNVAPTQIMPVVRRVEAGEGARELALLRWGLIPGWAKDAAIGAKLINVRADTVAAKFRAALAARRCLVPADGFYEWRAEGGERQPYLIRAPGCRPFAFAGLWERWTARASGAGIAEGETVETYGVLTTEASARLREIHARMPVVLASDAHEAWLGGAPASDLLRPAPDDALEFFAVSRRVNNVRNDDPGCLALLAEQPPARAAPQAGRGMRDLFD